MLHAIRTAAICRSHIDDMSLTWQTAAVQCRAPSAQRRAARGASPPQQPLLPCQQPRQPQAFPLCLVSWPGCRPHQTVGSPSWRGCPHSLLTAAHVRAAPQAPLQLGSAQGFPAHNILDALSLSSTQYGAVKILFTRQALYQDMDCVTVYAPSSRSLEIIIVTHNLLLRKAHLLVQLSLYSQCAATCSAALAAASSACVRASSPLQNASRSASAVAPAASIASSASASRVVA